MLARSSVCHPLLPPGRSPGLDGVQSCPGAGLREADHGANLWSALAGVTDHTLQSGPGTEGERGAGPRCPPDHSVALR